MQKHLIESARSRCARQVRRRGEGGCRAQQRCEQQTRDMQFFLLDARLRGDAEKALRESCGLSLALGDSKPTLAHLWSHTFS